MKRYKSKEDEIMDIVDKSEEKQVGIEEAVNHLGVNKGAIRNWIKKKMEYQLIEQGNYGSLNYQNLMSR